MNRTRDIPRICVPLTGTEEKELLQQASAAKKAGADMLEWRADCFAGWQDLQKLESAGKKLRETIGALPLLFTFRTEDKEQPETEAFYEQVNTAALEALPIDDIDLEVNRETAVVKRLRAKAKERKVRTLFSFHDFKGTPSQEAMERLLARMSALGADCSKIAVMPAQKSDVWRLMSTVRGYVERTGERVIGISMGRQGTISRMAGQLFGSVLTFGTVGAQSAPGQIPVQELRQALAAVDTRLKGRKLYLVGYMGTGKTTIARELERRTGVASCEMDQMIVEQMQMSIPEIFRQKGETCFRDLETELLNAMSGREGCIVSCGGGVCLREKNIHLMRDTGVVVWLTATPENVYERIRGDGNRPILAGNMTEANIAEMMRRREAHYRKAADIVIPTDGSTIAEIGTMILEELEDYFYKTTRHFIEAIDNEK